MRTVWYPVSSSGQTLTLAVDVIEHFRRHQQSQRNRAEAGGQLFATFSGSSIEVSRATGPRKSDRRSPFGFKPNRGAERREIKKLFRVGLHYVGDWHTHPQRIPVPSSTDVENITDMFRKSRHSLAGFLMIIVGTASFPDGLFVAVCDYQSCYALKAL